MDRDDVMPIAFFTICCVAFCVLVGLGIYFDYKATESREKKCIAVNGQFISGPRDICVKPNSIIMIDDISVGDGGMVIGDGK